MNNKIKYIARWHAEDIYKIYLSQFIFSNEHNINAIKCIYDLPGIKTMDSHKLGSALTEIADIQITFIVR